MRLDPASLYPHERASVLVPLPWLPIAARIDALGERWQRKHEFHVTAVSTNALAARLARERGISEEAARDAAWDAIAAAVAGRSAGPVALRDELRVVREGEERTIIAMADVEGLDELHDELGKRLELQPQPPPAHVTLYTRPGGEGIGLHSASDLQRLSAPLDERPFRWPPADASGRERVRR